MKRFFVLMMAILAFSAVPTFAQRNIDPAIDRDPLLETDAKHNLDVAWQAFKPLKKAYKQVLLRFDETFVAYPEFSKMDEFLYLAGMSSHFLSENKGRQKVDQRMEKDKRFAPEKLKEDAVAYLSMLVEKYPDSKYREEAQKTLEKLKTAQ